MCPKYTVIRQELHSELVKVAKYSIGTILYGDKEKSVSVNTNTNVVYLVMLSTYFAKWNILMWPPYKSFASLALLKAVPYIHDASCS